MPISHRVLADNQGPTDAAVQMLAKVTSYPSLLGLGNFLECGAFSANTEKGTEKLNWMTIYL
jgi:hypothetical protein